MLEVVQTPRLRLCEMSLDDLDFVAAMLSHDEVMRFYPAIFARDDAQRWIERQMTRYAANGHGLWLVLDKASDTPVGQVGLSMQDVNGALEPEIGYLLHRPFWGRGYAIEAAAAVRDWAFSNRDFDRVVSLIRDVNAPSRRVAERIGMRHVGEAMHAGLKHLVYAVEPHKFGVRK